MSKSQNQKKKTGRSERRVRRNRIIAGVIAVILVITMVLSLVLSAAASEVSGSSGTVRTVKSGITLNGTDISGWTLAQVEAEAEAAYEEMKNAVITICGADEEQQVTVSANNLGISWSNSDIADEIISYGNAANIIARYKQEKDLERSGADFTIEVDFDEDRIRTFLENNCLSWNEEAVEPTMTRSNGSFIYTEGSDGIVIDEDASVSAIYTYLTTEWDGSDVTLELDMTIEEPSTTVEELQQLTSILGTYTTHYSTSNTARSANITNACAMIDGISLAPGESFSTLDVITPFTEENGYQLAGSYVGNEVVDSFGGGICQVSTTLYNAVIRAELEVTMRYCHSMSVSYVDLSADAAIAESSGMDFCFTNNTDYTIYIEGYTTSGGYITFNIYGVETRDANRTVTFESETLTTTPSEGVTVKEDASLAVGTVEVTSGYTGYTAQLWKIVTVDGVEESRTVFNTSTYNMTPTTVTVGTAGTVTEELQAAMESGDIEAIQTAAANAAAGTSSSELDELTALAQAAADEAYAAALAEGKDTTTALEEAQEAANAVVANAASASTDTSTDTTASASEDTATDAATDTTASAEEDAATDTAASDTSSTDTSADSSSADATSDTASDTSQ